MKMGARQLEKPNAQETDSFRRFYPKRMDTSLLSINGYILARDSAKYDE